jgi:hypothetical protein
LLFAREARAQLHYDVSAEAGVMKRFLSNRPPGAGNAGFGPAAQFTGHLALLPLVHVGAYVGGDVSPVSHGKTREIGDAGLHVKGFLPLFPKSMRAYIFTGFGYAGNTAGGGFFDVPFGLGASYKFRKPFSVFAELGGRAEFADSGHAYAAGNSEDRLGLSLAIGLMVDL